MEINVTKTAALTFNNTLIKASVDGVPKFEVGDTGSFVIGRGDTVASNKGFEVFRLADGANQERFYFGYSGTDVLINPFVGGTGVLTDFKIQYNSATKLRLKSDGANLVLSASATPSGNGDLLFERTSDTVLTAKLKGQDGTVRGAKIPLVESPVDPPLGSGGGGGGNVTISTSEPSGGSDGDVWYQVPA
jgi:hypothetical protein